MQRARAVRFPNNTPDPEDHANSASRPSVHNAPRTLAARPRDNAHPSPQEARPLFDAAAGRCAGRKTHRPGTGLLSSVTGAGPGRRSPCRAE